MKRPYQRQSASTVRRDRLTTTDSYGQNLARVANLTGQSIHAIIPPTTHRPGTARAALSYRDFRLIWIGLFLSNIGTWMQNFTLPAYIEHRTESAALVGLLVFTQLGPLLLLSIPAGVLADRLPRRPFLIGMQLVQMVFSVALAGLVAGRLRRSGRCSPCRW